MADRQRETEEVAARELALAAALRGCIPWVAACPRGAAQEALAIACELVGYDPYDWTAAPDVLTKRRALLGMPDRRKADRG